MAFTKLLFAIALVVPALTAPLSEVHIRAPSNSKSRLSLVFFTISSTHLPAEVIASLFGWNWNSIANECSALASVGYGYVQGC